MQFQQTTEIDALEFEKSLGPDLNMRKTWESLKAAVIAGHAVFLRASSDADTMNFEFLVKGFQNFFAASEAGQSEGGTLLPKLECLLTYLI